MLINFYYQNFYTTAQSDYEQKIMLKYFELLRNNTNYNDIAFLIPDLRFKKDKLHKYRLDFTITSADESINKVKIYYKRVAVKNSHSIVAKIKELADRDSRSLLFAKDATDYRVQLSVAKV